MKSSPNIWDVDTDYITKMLVLFLRTLDSSICNPPHNCKFPRPIVQYVVTIKHFAFNLTTSTRIYIVIKVMNKMQALI